MRALAKAPADRFNPVGQFSAALEQVPHTMSVASAPSTRSRSRWPLVAVAFGALVVAGAAWAMYSRRAPNAAVPTEAASTRSIAVLPFANIGGDTAVVPLILGMHAEMVTQLTKLGGLTVASRASALGYRNTTKSEKEIAGELGVVSLLTGSVQRAGDQVRFSVALTDARKGTELWAESYDRQYTAANLFAVQGDIARQVANALSVQLSERQQQQIAKAPTSNLQALDLYYRALVLLNDRSPRVDTTTVRLLEQAVVLDPQFAAAWGLLTQARGWLVRRSVVNDTIPAFTALRRTQELAPGSLEAVLAQGYYRYYALGDFAGALQQLEAANRLMPNSSEMLYATSLLQRRLGRWDESLALMSHAARLDPRNPAIPLSLSDTYFSMRRTADAEREIDRSLTIAPGSEIARVRKLRILQWVKGDTAEARRFGERVVPTLSPLLKGYYTGRVALLARNYRGAIEAYRSLPPGFDTGVYQEHYLATALAAAASGDTATARTYADSLLRLGRAELARLANRGPSDPFGTQAQVASEMAVAHALRGERADALRLMEIANRYDLSRDALEGSHPMEYVAVTYAILGMKREAVAVIAKMLSVPSTLAPAELRLDPMYDGLRSDPAFQKLVGAETR
jgi:serine/threonine-protein kinase